MSDQKISKRKSVATNVAMSDETKQQILEIGKALSDGKSLTRSETIRRMAASYYASLKQRLQAGKKPGTAPPPQG